MENYFELYQIKPLFFNDRTLIEKQFQLLSAKHKLDQFLLSDDARQTEAERMCEKVKQAYRTLTDTELLMAHILKLNGVLEEGEQYELDPDFLIEMMELGELVTEYELDPGNELIKKDASEALETELQYWKEETTPMFKKFDETGGDKELMMQIKDYYFRWKYLRHLKQRLDLAETD